MPVTKSAKKALKQDRKRRQFNLRVKRRIQDAVSSFKSSPTPEKLSNIYKVVDIAAKKNIFHKNKASRIKSNMANLLAEKGKSSKKPKNKQKPREK